MKILYDATVFSSQKVGGISRYHYELCKGMRKLNYDLKIAGIASKNKYTLADPILRKKLIKDPTAMLAAFNKYAIKKALRKSDENTVYHPSNLYEHVLDVIPANIKVVLTIHDMIIEREDNRIDTLKQKFAKRADKIIAISHATKHEAMDILGLPEEKFEVIYHGASLSLDNIKKIDYIPEKFLLYVGGRRKHKNINFFLSSIANILTEDKDLYMILAGGKKLKPEEIDFFEKHGISDKVIVLTGLEDEELAYLYSKAYAFIFASYYEGFGIPILEAWSCKTPLIISDNACFKEIAKDAAIYFDPYSEASIQEAVSTLLNNEELRQSLISKGNERLKNFSWEKTAKQTAKVYEDLFK